MMTMTPTKRGYRLVAEDGVASAYELQGDIERQAYAHRRSHGPAKATLDTYHFLKRYQPAKLAAWIDGHPNKDDLLALE